MDANDPSQCRILPRRTHKPVCLFSPPSFSPTKGPPPRLPTLVNLPVFLNDPLKWLCPRNGLMMKEWLKAKQRGDEEREKSMDVIGELRPDKVCLFEPCSSIQIFFFLVNIEWWHCNSIADEIAWHHYHAFPTFLPSFLFLCIYNYSQWTFNPN